MKYNFVLKKSYELVLSLNFEFATQKGNIQGTKGEIESQVSYSKGQANFRLTETSTWYTNWEQLF